MASRHQWVRAATGTKGTQWNKESHMASHHMASTKDILTTTDITLVQTAIATTLITVCTCL